MHSNGHIKLACAPSSLILANKFLPLNEALYNLGENRWGGWLSFICIKTIPMGNAYAVWTGIGAVGVAIVGIVWFNEIADLKRIACISLIVLGVAGLKLLDSGSSVV